MKSGRRPKIFEPLFLKNGSVDFSKNFRDERECKCLPMCKFWGKFIVGKNITSKFSKIWLGGHGPQTIQKFSSWLGGPCGGRRPPSTCAASSLYSKSFPSNWGSKKNIWRHLASKPEAGRSRDLTGRRGSTGSTSCQNLGSFGQPVSELWDVEVSVESPYYVQKYENGLV